MDNKLKKEIYDYLVNGGSEGTRANLAKKMQREMNYVDLENMALCTDDLGCEKLTMEQLAVVADKLEDRLMESFNSELHDVIFDLNY